MTDDREEAVRIPFKGMRGAVARGMTAAWQAPRVATGVAVDMRASLRRLEELRSRCEGAKVTLTHLIVRAAALTLLDHPRLSGYVDDQGVTLADRPAIGLAVSLDEGIVVPVIRDAAERTVCELAAETRTLAQKAREGSLLPGEMKGGTFSISTLGATGIDWFTPILNPPQIAILGVGRLAEVPIAEAGEVVVAPSVELTLVYDHRAVDGVPASRMLAALRDRLEAADLD